MFWRNWGWKTLVLFSWSFLTSPQNFSHGAPFWNCVLILCQLLTKTDVYWLLRPPSEPLAQPPKQDLPLLSWLLHSLPTPLDGPLTEYRCILFWVCLAFLVLLGKPVSGCGHLTLAMCWRGTSSLAVGHQSGSSLGPSGSRWHAKRDVLFCSVSLQFGGLCNLTAGWAFTHWSTLGIVCLFIKIIASFLSEIYF